MRRGPALLLALALALAPAGCGPRLVQRAAEGVPVAVAGPAARLADYNRGPSGVRVQGRLTSQDRGSAVFAATAVAGQGVRLDAVSGAFSRPLLGVACAVGGSCRSYLPQRRQVLEDPTGAWGPWLVALLRGRLPVVGEPAGARRLGDGSEVLALAGHGAWLTEVEFAVGAEMPRRAVYSRAGIPELEVMFAEPLRVDGWVFPGRIALTPGRGEPGYALEFRQVEAGATPAAAQELRVPQGTELIIQEGMDTWSETRLPLWLPTLPP